MIIPSGFAQVNLKFTGAAVPLGAECTFGVLHQFSGLDPAEVANEVAVRWGAVMENFTTVVAVTSILVKYGPSVSGPSAEIAVNLPGTSATQAVAPNTSVLVQKRTALGGRVGRGRMYLPGVREDYVSSGGALDSGFVTALQNDLDTFHAGLITEVIPAVLLHGENSPVTVPNEITSFGVSSRVATQRTRLRR